MGRMLSSLLKNLVQSRCPHSERFYDEPLSDAPKHILKREPIQDSNSFRSWVRGDFPKGLYCLMRVELQKASDQVEVVAGVDFGVLWLRSNAWFGIFNVLSEWLLCLPKSLFILAESLFFPVEAR